jgi:hypothetical protein
VPKLKKKGPGDVPAVACQAMFRLKLPGVMQWGVFGMVEQISCAQKDT